MAALIIVGAMPAQAQPVAQDPAKKRVALVIGNAAYAAPLRTLANSVNDATAMAATLASLHFEVELLRDVTVAEMDQAVSRFETKLRESGAVGLFYFSGHGLQVDGINYLLPLGARAEHESSIGREALAASSVLDKMSAAREGVNIVILDACRDEPFAGRGPGGESKSSATGRGLAAINARADGTVIAYATAPGKTASDGAGVYGAYTGELLKYLKAEGLTIDQVLRKNSGAVQAATQGAQVPWMSISLAEDFFMNPVAEASVAELLAFAQSNYAAGDFVSVRKHLERARNGASARPNAAQRLEIDALDARAMRQLATLRLEIKPQTASVLIDGSTHRSYEGLLRVNPGRFEVRITSDGYRSVTRSLQLGPGASEMLALELSRRITRWPAWVAGGVGAAALLTSLTTGVFAKQRKNELAAHCDGTSCTDSGDFPWRDVRDRGQRLAISSDVMLGVGLAGLATSAVFVFAPHWFSRGGNDSGLARINCSKTGCLAQARFRFH
jgi:uncharacterized caspase-like protein